MTMTDELKILDDKIKANQAQYDLSGEAAKISALHLKIFWKSMNIWLVKRHKPSIFEKAKFEYSPLGMSLSKAFKKDEVKSVV